jgi:hypothetical protein
MARCFAPSFGSSSNRRVEEAWGNYDAVAPSAEQLAATLAGSSGVTTLGSKLAQFSLDGSKRRDGLDLIFEA